MATAKKRNLYKTFYILLKEKYNLDVNESYVDELINNLILESVILDKDPDKCLSEFFEKNGQNLKHNEVRSYEEVKEEDIKEKIFEDEFADKVFPEIEIEKPEKPKDKRKRGNRNA